MASLNKIKNEKESQKRISFFLLLTLIEIFITLWLQHIIDQILKNIAIYNFNMNLDYSYLNAIKSLLANEINQGIFILLQIGYLGFIFIFILRPKPELTGQTMMVTDRIEIPVPVGSGQYGNERFMLEAEKKQKYGIFQWNGNLKNLSGGLIVHKVSYGSKEILYYEKENHSLIVSTTGAGKTRRVIIPTLGLLILSGKSIVTSDIKGELYAYTSDYAIENGYDIIVIDIKNPLKSMHYNFMQPILDAIESNNIPLAINYTWDLVSVLVGEQKGEPLWYNGESATIAAAILIVALDAPKQYCNLTNVYYFIANMCMSSDSGEMKLISYLNKLDDTHPAKGVFSMATIAADKTRSSFFTSALGTLRLFTDPGIAEMTSKSDFKLADISAKKTVLYIIVPDDNKSRYSLVSTFITQLYNSQMQQADKNGGVLLNYTDYILEELGNFPFIPVLGNMLSAGRSRGIRVNIVLQDLQQLENRYKDDCKNIMTNCKNKLYLLSDDPKTLKQFSDNVGRYTVEVSSVSESVSSGIGRNDGSSFSASSNLTGRALLEPAELKRFNEPYALCMQTGEYAAINILPDLCEYKFNNVFELGDKEHNRKLMVQKELSRKERIIPKIQLWEIWNKFVPKEVESAKKSNKKSFLN